MRLDLDFIDGKVIYKGVDIGITRENIMDYQLQTGLDPKEWIEYLYNELIRVKRDNVLEKILNKDV